VGGKLFTFHGSGAVKRFVITTSVNQNLTTNNKYQAAYKFGKNDWIINKSVYFDILGKQKCLCEGDPELSMTRNCQVHCIYNHIMQLIASQFPCGVLDTVCRLGKKYSDQNNIMFVRSLAFVLLIAGKVLHLFDI